MCRQFQTFAETYDWEGNGRSAFATAIVSQTLVFWLIASRLFELGHEHPSGNMMISALFTDGNGGARTSPDLISLYLIRLTSFSFLFSCFTTQY